MTTDNHAEQVRKAGFGDGEKPLGFLSNSPESPGQRYPRHYPHLDDPLGTPLSIREVALMLGCSAWTVRQKLLPGGLPHFRSGSNGKLVFFRDQVVAWVLQQQKKGGKP